MVMILDDDYYKFEQAQSYLLNKLGISQLDFWKERAVLTPYYYHIMTYLGKELSIMESTELKKMIERVFEIFEWGGDLIIAHDVNTLMETIGLVSEGNDVDILEESLNRTLSAEQDGGSQEIIILGAESENPSEKPDEQYMCFCWGDFMSTLCLRLKFQYGYLFAQEPDGECCVCGARGQTETDYESWESGVYPQDECYDRTNYTRSNTAWGVQKDRFCECYRHNT